MKINKLPLIYGIFWILVWALLSQIINRPLLLASPFQTLKALLNLLSTASFYRALITSLSNIILGFICGFLIGLGLAISSYRFRFIKDLLTPLIISLKSLPLASIVILLLVWLSSRYLSIVVVMILVIPIFYENILVGLENSGKNLLKMAKVFKIDLIVRTKYIYMAEILPFLKNALKLAIGMSFKAGVAAEVIGLSQNSLGENLYLSKIYLDTPNLFAYSLVIILISYGMEKIIIFLLDIFYKRLGGQKL